MFFISLIEPKKDDKLPGYLQYGVPEDCEALKIDVKAIEEDSRRNVHGEQDGYAKESKMKTCDCCCCCGCNCDPCYFCCCCKNNCLCCCCNVQ